MSREHCNFTTVVQGRAAAAWDGEKRSFPGILAKITHAFQKDLTDKDMPNCHQVFSVFFS